jgi:hypothetical protein
MTFPAISPPNPRVTSYRQWAGYLSEQLAQYNVPSPGNEDLWKSWAQALYSTPEIAERGLPSPQMFADWRSWACQALNALE